MKKLLLLVLFLSLNAKLIDKVEVVVDNTPITSYDIEKSIKTLHLDKKSAIEYLIQQALIDNEIKKRGILIDDYLIDSKLEDIAQQNGTNLYQLKQYLISKGQLDSFIKKLRDNLKREKLFDAISYSKIRISKDDMESYYNSHKQTWTHFKTAEITEYSSKNVKNLQVIKQNPLSNVEVKIEDRDINSSSLPFALMKMINDTPEEGWTKIFRTPTGFSMIYVSKKSGKVTTPFEKVKNLIYSILADKEKERVIKNYFQEKKNRATIKFLYKDTKN